MKQVFKHWLLAAAFMSAGLAQAAERSFEFPWLPVSGAGNLVLTGDGVSALVTAGTIVDTPSVTPSLPGLPGAGAHNAAFHEEDFTPLPEKVGVALQFSSLSFSDDGQTLTGLKSPNSLVELSRPIYNTSTQGFASERSVYLADLDWNLVSATIYANLYSYNHGTNELVDLGKQAIFHATQPGIVGGTQGHVVLEPAAFGGVWNGHVSGSLAGDLRLDSNTSNLILTGLGLSTQGSVANLWRDANWGTASFAAPAVPEPSTCAMFGVGMVLLGGLARRRKAA